MVKENTEIRLKRIMAEKKLRQVDILRMSVPWQKKLGVKISKNTLSQYINGKSSPDSWRITLLSKTLGVDEAWLLGYDVPMKSSDADNQKEFHPIMEELTKVTSQLKEPRQQIVLDTANIQLEEQKEEENKVIPFLNENSSVDKKSLQAAIEEAEQVDESKVNWDEWVSFDGKPITDEVKAAMKLLLGKRLED